MRKNIRKFAGIVLCIGMFTGCAQTPDSSLVKPKGSKAVDAYTEADDVSGSKGCLLYTSESTISEIHI